MSLGESVMVSPFSPDLFVPRVLLRPLALVTLTRDMVKSAQYQRHHLQMAVAGAMK